MKIKKILSRHRRDFEAVYECEHCNYESESYGYDDANFHENVIPNMTCPNCAKTSGDDYVPMAPIYPANYVI
jgi:transcription elongation factor Elf1